MKFICLKWEFLMMWVVILFAMLLLDSCVHEPLVVPVTNPEPPIEVTECDENTVYFQNDVLPLLVSNCAMSGCHDAKSAEEDIVLDSYANIMRSGIVKAFDPNDSELYEKIIEQDRDDVMPPPPASPLQSAQIATIREWIAQGAQNNFCNSSVCDTLQVTFSGSVVPLLSTKCLGCHSGNAPSGNISLATYTGVQAVAQNGRLIGSISHTSGFVAMPQGGAKLSDCEIAMVKIWIDDNTPNN